MIVVHEGNAPLNFLWTLVGSPTGSTVTIANANDNDGLPLVLSDCSGITELAIGGETHAVYADGDGVEGGRLVRPGSGWMALVPGANDLTITGIDGTFRHYKLDL